MPLTVPNSMCIPLAEDNPKAQPIVLVNGDNDLALSTGEAFGMEVEVLCG